MPRTSSTAGRLMSFRCRTARSWCPTSRTAPSTASRMEAIASRLQGEALVRVMFGTVWRPLLIGLAVATVSIGETSAQGLAERARLCGTCHGEDGNSRMPNIPSLAGQPEFFIINQLFLMREGVRKVEAMAALVKDLKDDDLQALAKHYAAQPPKASGEPIDPALVRRGSELSATRRCGS